MGEGGYKIPNTKKQVTLYTITETEAQHEKEVAVIRNQIDKSPYAGIYCGDINATPASYTYNKLKANMQDAFLQKGAGFGATYYGFLYTLRIDVCLVAAQLKTMQCTIPRVRLSDHFPVVTDVSWR